MKSLSLPTADMSHSDSRSPGSVFTILLVDDDASFRDAIVNVLHKLAPGWTIRQESNGADALSTVTSEQIDCVLLDYRMAGGSGLSWLVRIKEAKEELPVIMLTGEGNELIAVGALKNGASDYLVKGSIEPSLLHRAILHAVESTRMKYTIEAQRQTLMAAERQRVMIESLATACHHLGQPATVVATCLSLMRRQHPSPELENVIAECEAAVNSMTGILERLQHVNEYRTVPYLPESESDQRIIEI